MKTRKTTGAGATPQTGGNFFTAPVLQFAYWEGGAERDRVKWGESLMVKRWSPMPRCTWRFAIRSQSKYGKRTLASGVQEVAVSHVGKVAVFFCNGATVKLRGRFFFFFWNVNRKSTSVSSVYTSLAARFSHSLFFSSRLLSVVSRSQEQELLLLLSQHWKWSVGLESARAHTRWLTVLHDQGSCLILSKNVKHSCYCYSIYMKIHLGSDLNLSLGISVKSKLKSILN